MRIDGASKSSAAVKANVGDLMSRLDAGDVVRAKVLEITSDEAVLRLFDGTVMKAKLAEKLDAKAGQTITLSVASKSEGTLILETVKDMNSRLQVKPDILKNILDALNLKPDNKNMEVAAELMKAGEPVTKDSIGKALQLMDAVNDLTADKAVFLSSKNIDGNQLDSDLTNKLLNGELKLGKLLVELRNAIEQAAGNTSDGAAASKNGGNVPQDLHGRSAGSSGTNSGQVSGQASSQVSGQTSGQALSQASAQASGSSSASTDSVGNPAVILSGRQSSDADIKSQTQSASANGGKAGMNAPTAAPDRFADTINSRAGDVGPVPGQSDDETLSGKTSNNLHGNNNSGGDISAGSAGRLAASGKAGHTGDAGNKAVLIASSGNTSEGSHENISLKASVNGRTASAGDPSADEAYDRQAGVRAASDAFSKMNEATKGVFVGADSDKLASELKVDKLYRDLDTRLDSVKSAVHAADLQGTKTDIISNAANMLSDTIRLIDQLNTGGLLYYQIPVKISERNTTAELYIMKKQKNKKQIDPQNTVMFISLDTENLGRVETLIDVKGKNIGIQLRTEKQEINNYIKEYTKDLYNGLSELGYKLTGIRFKVIDEPATPIKQERLLKEMEQGYMGRVDFRV